MFLNQKQQQGSALVVAIFIIVVMSVLAAVIARVISTTSASSVDEVYGARAFHAANSGAQIFLTNLFPLGEQGAVSNVCSNEASESFISEGLQGCSARVTCESTDFAAEYQLTHFRIISIGQCSAAGNNYSREIMIEAVDGNF